MDRDKAVESEKDHDWWTCPCVKCDRKRFFWAMQQGDDDDD